MNSKQSQDILQVKSVGIYDRLDVGIEREDIISRVNPSCLA